jgi:nucleotide-binding universal stress UspA family protein
VVVSFTKAKATMSAPHDVSRAELSAPSGERRRIRRVLVAFDGSAGSWAALEEGIAVAASEHALLTIAAVVEEPPVWVGMAPLAIPFNREGLRRDCERQVEQELAAARDEVPATVSVTTRLLHGRPGRELVRLAHEGDYDLVVAGPRSACRWRRLFGRSVTHTLLSRARTSVLAVKAP